MLMLSDIVLREITDVITVKASKGRHLIMYDRPCYGLSFCTSGCITYRMGDAQTVSDRTVAVLLPMHGNYTLYNNESGEFPLINFLLEGELPCKFFTIPIASLEPYLADFERLKEFYLKPGNRLKMLSVLYDILHRLSMEGRSGNALLQPVIDYIERHYCETALDNITLARVANISEVYLRKLFKMQYACTPKQYILSMRIERAKQLLCETRQSISRIALSCGFGGVYHFCRIFKLHTGATPTAWRRSVGQMM